MEQQIDGYCAIPHDTRSWSKGGRAPLCGNPQPLWFYFRFEGEGIAFHIIFRCIKVNSSTFVIFVFSLLFCVGDRVDLGRMKRNFESSLICFLCFLLHFSSKFCLSKMLAFVCFCYRTKSIRNLYGYVNVQYTTKYCLISFMIRDFELKIRNCFKIKT